jgi:hypothetical protein
MDFDTRFLQVKKELTNAFAFADHWMKTSEAFPVDSYMREQSRFLLSTLIQENSTWLTAIRDIKIERIFVDEQPAEMNFLPVLMQTEQAMLEADEFKHLKKVLRSQLEELNGYLDLLSYGTENYRIILILSECNELEVLQFVSMFSSRMQSHLHQLDSLTEAYTLSAT